MKARCGMIVAALLTGMGATAEEPYRTLTDRQGRSIDARIIRYNEADRSATIHPKGRSAITVPISTFSDEDQAYIIDWSHEQAFLDERILLMEISPIEKFDRYNVRKDDHGEEKGFYHYFIIKLANKSTVDLEGLTLEYVIFYQQEKHTGSEGWEKVHRNGTLYRRDSISIPHKSEKKWQTDPIRLVEYRADSAVRTAKVDLDSELDGMILRISMRTREGEILTREITYPDDLDNKWTTRTTNALDG